MSDLFANVDITEVRKALVAESNAHHASFKRLTAKRRPLRELTKAETDVLEAHSAAIAYPYLLAALLRITETRHGAAEAREMAAMCEAVMEAGTEVLEDANADLDEPARPAGPTPADIEAALDAKAEDDRIEAERVQ